MEESCIGREQQLSEQLSPQRECDDGEDVGVDLEGVAAGASEEPPCADTPPRFHFSWRKLLKFTGPGWLMSLAYLDPGNLESDLQQGAYTGLRLVWVLFWATVMGLMLQILAARIGVVTGRDLAETVRQEYPRWLNYVIYGMMEIAVIGSDIQAIAGDRWRSMEIEGDRW